MASFAPGLYARDVGEAAEPREDLAKLVLPIAGHWPGTDATAADAGDRAAFRVMAQLHGHFDFGKDLLEDESGVAVGKRVVFQATLAAARFAASAARVDENGDRYGHIAFG